MESEKGMIVRAGTTTIHTHTHAHAHAHAHTVTHTHHFNKDVNAALGATGKGDVDQALL